MVPPDLYLQYVWSGLVAANLLTLARNTLA
jgi:hypothetical protein